MDRKYMELYEEALQVQDACNLSGVVHAWGRILPKIWEEARKKGAGTDWVNQHPVNVAFAYKVADLTRVSRIPSTRVDDAFDVIQQVVQRLKALREADEVCPEDLEAAGEIYDREMANPKLVYPSEESCGQCDTTYETDRKFGKCSGCGYIEPACNACETQLGPRMCAGCENGSRFKEFESVKEGENHAT